MAGIFEDLFNDVSDGIRDFFDILFRGGGGGGGGGTLPLEYPHPEGPKTWAPPSNLLTIDDDDSSSSPHSKTGYKYSGPMTKDVFGNPIVPKENQSYSNCRYYEEKDARTGKMKKPKIDVSCLRSEMIRASIEEGPCSGLTWEDAQEQIATMIPVGEAIAKLRGAVPAGGSASAFAVSTTPTTTRMTTTTTDVEPTYAREHDDTPDVPWPRRPVSETLPEAEQMLIDAANAPYNPGMCGVWKPGYVLPGTVVEAVEGSGMVGGERSSRPEWYHQLGDWAGTKTRPIVSKYPRPYRPVLPHVRVSGEEGEGSIRQQQNQSWYSGTGVIRAGRYTYR